MVLVVITVMEVLVVSVTSSIASVISSPLSSWKGAGIRRCWGGTLACLTSTCTEWLEPGVAENDTGSTHKSSSKGRLGVVKGELIGSTRSNVHGDIGGDAGTDGGDMPTRSLAHLGCCPRAIIGCCPGMILRMRVCTCPDEVT